MPGSGKSTIGRKLSKKLDIDFVDTDFVISQQSGLSVSEIFHQYGEKIFRDIESNVLTDQIKIEESSSVISTGGGMILKEENRRLIKENSFCCYLHIKPASLVARLENDHSRPLLQVDDKLQKLEDLYQKRHELYVSTCHFQLEVDRYSVGKAVSKIAAVSQQFFANRA